MELRVLRYFLTVIQEESITKAAAALHITQPTLSRQLLQLEQELGVSLLVRGARRVTLTDEGALLRRRAQEMLELEHITKKEIKQQEKQVQGKITIGCGETAAVQQLANIICGFTKKYSMVTYDIFTANADLVKEQMDKGLIDIGLLLEPIDIEKYEFIRLNIKEKWVCLMHPNSPLATKDYITPKDLAKLPLIMPRRAQVQNQLAGWFGNYYNNLNVLFTSNFSTNGGIMVQQGLGYSLVVEGAIPLWNKELLVNKPLYPALTATSVLAWKRGQPFSLAAAKFIGEIKCLLGIG